MILNWQKVYSIKISIRRRLKSGDYKIVSSDEDYLTFFPYIYSISHEIIKTHNHEMSVDLELFPSL